MNEDRVFEILTEVQEGAPITLGMVAEVFGPAIYDLVDAEMSRESDGQQ